jgi:hypothetical protein
MSDPLISIEHNGSTHARKASEWIALSRAALASPAAKIEEPDLIAEMREDAQDGRTTNKTVLDYIDAPRAALVAKEKVERETIERCAKVCEGLIQEIYCRADRWAHDVPNAVREECAIAIRALKCGMSEQNEQDV